MEHTYTPRDIHSFLGKQILFFDGGTGSVLQTMGLKPGELPELWNITHRENIIRLHYDYFCAGANIIKTNTFGAFVTKFPDTSTVATADCTDTATADCASSETDTVDGVRSSSFKNTPNNTGAAADCADTASDSDTVADSAGAPTMHTIVRRAVANAHEARRRIECEPLAPDARTPDGVNVQSAPHFIALDIGPSGKLLEPLGDLSFDGAVQLFAATIGAGLLAGVDLVLIETMNDVYEAKAAVIAAKEAIEQTGIAVPIFVTTVYDEGAKSLTGSCPGVMVSVLESLGVAALGLNCSLGPKQMMPIVDVLLQNASIPLIVNPNAGLPRSEGGKTVYDVSPKEFASLVCDFAQKGAGIVGGCCGTTPEYIRLLAEQIRKKECRGEIQAKLPTDKNLSLVTSCTRIVRLGSVPVLIGERINPTGKKRFKEALRTNDIAYILNEAVTQEANGAHILDVNVGLPEIDEAQMMVTVIKELQAVTELPLQIDTSDTVAMEKALRYYNGKPLVNSVNGKAEVMRAVFPLVKKYGGVVVALTIDENGIPETADGRIRIIEKIYKTAAEYGIKPKNIIIDPLAMAVSSDEKAAHATLETLSYVKTVLHGNTILGISNISFGLPERDLITASFFTMALQCGLSAAIMNPASLEMQKAYTCFCTLSGFDSQCATYIDFASRYKEKLAATLGTQIGANHEKTAAQSPAAATDTAAKPNATDTTSLVYAVTKGLKDLAETRTKEFLATLDSMDVINNHIIPALDIVGKGFEEKTLYLPQLLMAAEAAKAAFAVIKTHLEKSGAKEESRGTIILATVKGDIHDIGKNIVKVLLENYSFTVIDLGKDVPPELIAETCVAKKVRLVGLSALMTTTVPAMEETIKLLRKSAPWCRVCVGGAVLTQEYADMIGADFYGKDAMDTVKYAQKVFAEEKA